MNMLLLKKTLNSLNHRSPTLSQVVHFHPWISSGYFEDPKNTPWRHTASNPPRQLEGHRQGTLRLRQNRPRSRELRLRCYDLLSYTTPGVFQSNNFFGRKSGKTGRLEFFAGKNIKLSQKKNKTHWKKTPLPKKNSSS